MHHKKALQLTSSEFKRLYGVSKETFNTMIEEVAKAKLGKQGSPSKLLIPDQILLTLQYLREYRTFFHVAKDCGVHKSTAWRTVIRIDDILIKSTQFRLPSKRQLQQNQTEIKVIVIDVAEIEIERSQKNRKATTVENNAAIPSKCS